MINKEKRQFIYVLKDPISLKIKYVGKTSNPDDRLKRHMNDCNLKNSWTKKSKWLLHLKNNNLNPIMEIIDEGTDSNINELEIKWIKHYRDNDIYLSNETEGGDGFNWTGLKHKDESIIKMKMNHPLRKSVIQFDMDNNIVNKFNSSYEAADYMNTSRGFVAGCCNNKPHYITLKGFYFRYIDNYFPCPKSNIIPDINDINDKLNILIEDEKKLLKEINFKKKNKSGVKGFKVIQYDLDGNILGRYNTMSDASEKTKCHIALISNCCKKKTYYTVNGTTFRYEGDVFDYIAYNKNIQVNSKGVYKYDLDGNFLDKYDSIRNAAIQNNTQKSNISQCCKKKYKKNGGNIIVGGFIWRYEGDIF